MRSARPEPPRTDRSPGPEVRPGTALPAAPPFEALAAHYDDWCRTPLGQLTEQVELQALRAATADLAPGERLLDLGCGTGSFALDAARRGARVTGVDHAPAMVAASRAKARAAGIAADFRVADAGALPFPSRSFQWVTALLVLEFARDPSTVLHEAVRVLTPDGRVVVAALNRWSLWTLARRLRGMFHPTIYRQARFLSRARLYRLLQAAGFSPQTWWGAVYYPPVYHPRLATPYLGWEAWGRRWLPGASAYLVIRARPRQAGGRAASVDTDSASGHGEGESG